MNISLPEQQNISLPANYDELSIELIEHFLLMKQSEGVTSKTLRRYTDTLHKFYNFFKDKPITKNSYIEYNNHLISNGYADSSVRGEQQTIKTFFGYLIQNEWHFPLPNFKLQKLHKHKLSYLEPEGIQQLFKYDLSIKERLVLRLFISTGIRLSEIVALNWNDINFTSGAVQILCGKGQKYRTTVLDHDTANFMLKYKIRNKLGNESPVLSIRNKRMTTSGINSLIYKLRKRTGVYFSAHSLRRTFARQSILHDMPIIYLSQMMGHSSLDLTRDYVGKLDAENLTLQYHNHFPLRGIR